MGAFGYGAAGRCISSPPSLSSLRCFYLAMPLALWLFGALWLLVGSAVLCIVLYMMDHLD